MTSYSKVSVSCQHAFGHCAEDDDDIDQCIEDINLLQLIEVVLMVCERPSRFAIRQSSHTIADALSIAFDAGEACTKPTSIGSTRLLLHLCMTRSYAANTLT